MKDIEFENLLLTAAAEADKMKNKMNRQLAKETEKDSSIEYEATYKAMFYHQLLKHGMEYQKISMENSPEVKDNKSVGKKRLDLWLNNADKVYLLEVKLIGVAKSKKGLRKVNGKYGVLGDLLKLTEIVNCFDRNTTFGVAIAVYNGEYDEVDCKMIESKLKSEVTDLINRNIKLMICANGKAEYVKK